MARVPCFIYKEGEHFSLPDPVNRLTRHISMFAVRGRDGLLHPHPSVFTETEDPHAAEFFLFPLDIGPAVDFQSAAAIDDVIAGLPYFAGRSERHIITDCADGTGSIAHDVCLFKMSVTEHSGYADRAVVLWYDPSPHVLAHRAGFDLTATKYDVSFVGAFSHASRTAAVHSIQVEAPELRFFVKGERGLSVTGTSFSKTCHTGEDLCKRRALFVKTMRDSATVLCPPGVGPQSVRMYETMYMGRIPVLFDFDIIYPFMDRIDYGAFSCIIPKHDIAHTGPLLRDWLGALTPRSDPRQMDPLLQDMEHIFHARDTLGKAVGRGAENIQGIDAA